jgi:type II secretion system protein J
VKIESKVESLNRCNVKSLRRCDSFCGSTNTAFTLIEMILAIGIASLALLCVSAVLFTALHLRNATSEMVDAATPVDAAITFLKRDLQCCVTPTNGTSKVLSGGFRVGNGIASSGVSDPVAIEMFTATGALSERQPWGEIQRVTYELKNPENIHAAGKDLYRSVMRNLLTASAPAVEDQLMLNGVESIRFSGFDGAQWQDTWDTTSPTSVNTNLPLAVKVEIQMTGNAKSQPVELVVPIDAVSRTNMVLSSTSGS